jgi:uncharacterized protein YabE (DUF348 family)/3D (Asp-Asp-Asp) domain-containing protein
VKKSKKQSRIYSKNRFSKRRKAMHRAGALLSLALIAATVTVICLKKTITVEADGKQYKVVTLSSTYAKALESKNIIVGPEDETVPSLDSKIEKGSTIKITRASNVKINVDGKALSFTSSAANVGDMLKAQGITISQYDKVSPSVTTQLKSGMEVSITRVTTSDITAVSPVAFETVTKNDSTLKTGTTKVVQNGLQGEKTTVTRVFYENGKETSRTVVSETVTKQPVQKIVAAGTSATASTTASSSTATTAAATTAATTATATAASSTTVASAASTSSITDSRGGSISYSKALTVMATAYSEEESSNTWGLQTATGVDAVRDPNSWSTIAVDPSVIPLGTKVYVEGYGYAIAQDTGSAIIGKHIDCFFYTVADMNAWGTRTVNVYILN